MVSINIASDVALDLASGGLVKGFGAEVPYDQGLAEADAAIGALLGKHHAKQVAVPGVRDRSATAAGRGGTLPRRRPPSSSTPAQRLVPAATRHDPRT